MRHEVLKVSERGVCEDSVLPNFDSEALDKSKKETYEVFNKL